MGGSNRNKRDRMPNQSRRQTRQNKPRLANPESNTGLLNARLRSLGLYAASIAGDGNCLFRALSDQLYGSQSKHLELRQEICDFVEERKAEYAGFVDDERGIDVHLKCMRQPGTYGGHVELSAFARLKRRDVKVVQPDVVYVIEHRGLIPPEEALQQRKRSKTEALFPITEGTIYVAYHDWEHFSSLRNLKGPHTGLPHVCETTPENESPIHSPVLSKHKLKAIRGKPVIRLPPVNTTALVPSATHSSSTNLVKSKFLRDEYLSVPTPDPLAIPLPISREGSPLTVLSTSSEQSYHASGSGSASSLPSSLAPLTPPDGQMLSVSRDGRSPKRTFAESEGEEGGDGSVDGRRIRHKPNSTMSLPSTMCADSEEQEVNEELVDEEEEAETQTKDYSGFNSDSSLSPPPPEPDELRREAANRLLQRNLYQTNGVITSNTTSHSPSPTPSRPLTRRQRKALGLPKPKHAILIPGGRHPSRLRTSVSVVSADDSQQSDGLAEWEKNGSGRIDARGFKELRI